ncbi:FAD-binding oxidoreductase [Acanthopleuribacter pedis]|uniref:FAD-binding protein n=1 Tax=Acanthopleuribacter pedis TaxID=442870 RepID=A0A8J7QJV6_9BACT|nr:FAD-linked oxidase C-terminal domain-containing protein [Acanthopleuribacter pedis]MBO1319568.1 FAD-binding protein [Acanthopleuribacter pedis]
MSLEPALRRQLVALLGADWVRDDQVTRFSYRCDGLTLHPSLPAGVVFPGDHDQVVGVVKLLHAAGVSFLPRGAGTGLSGGAVPTTGAVIIELVRLNRIGPVNEIDRTIEVGPGVVNIQVSHAARAHGLYFVPDPSSQKACSVGGNVAENSGGPHTLKYGVTVNHILALDVVLPDGSAHRVGGESWASPGADLLALLIGSEGTLCIVTNIICRLTPLPPAVQTLLAVFNDVQQACEAVSAIIRAGIVPAALEMIDNTVIRAIEQTISAGFPTDAEAVLIIELEDIEAGITDELAAVRRILGQVGTHEIRVAEDEAARARIWRARKEAFGAIGALSPSFYTQDGVIPRGALPRVLARVNQIGRDHGLTIANVFHAGDGNLHPLILYDAHDPDQVAATHEVGRRILELCLAEGGTLSGEHGIGLEKNSLMDRVYSSTTLDHMAEVRAVFNPNARLNPGKMLPEPGKCGDIKSVAALRAKSGIQV